MLLLSGATASAGVFKCTDTGGNVQYRDTPCDSSTHSLRKLGESAPGAVAPDARMEKTQRLLDAIRDERLQKEQLEEKARTDELQQRRHCNRARDYLRNLERAGRVYDLDESGNRVYLPDDAREQALAQARENVRHWCH
jgi:hypothetical protein